MVGWPSRTATSRASFPPPWPTEAQRPSPYGCSRVGSWTTTSSTIGPSRFGPTETCWQCYGPRGEAPWRKPSFGSAGGALPRLSTSFTPSLGSSSMTQSQLDSSRVDLASLTVDQFHMIDELQRVTIRDERIITEKMAKVQVSCNIIYGPVRC
ncbi:unnamed protein product [Linum tenue]|uniref:Uncharacterized protein n=1 Tax=Linum tenue TaxID=586396 RepID=A0AAV0M382_9ROSI|nr:unnamed protein product [Linum tenue]